MADKTFEERINAPWKAVELQARSKRLRESGMYYGVQDCNENWIAQCITKEQAELIEFASYDAIIRSVLETRTERKEEGGKQWIEAK